MSKVNRRSFLKGLAVAAPVALTGDLTAESAQESVSKEWFQPSYDPRTGSSATAGTFVKHLDMRSSWLSNFTAGAFACTGMAMTENGIRKKTVR